MRPGGKKDSLRKLTFCRVQLSDHTALSLGKAFPCLDELHLDKCDVAKQHALSHLDQLRLRVLVLRTENIGVSALDARELDHSQHQGSRVPTSRYFPTADEPRTGTPDGAYAPQSPASRLSTWHKRRGLERPATRAPLFADRRLPQGAAAASRECNLAASPRPFAPLVRCAALACRLRPRSGTHASRVNCSSQRAGLAEI